MKRRILAMILALAICLALCACGSYRANDGTSDKAADNNGTAGTDRPSGTYDGAGNNAANGTGMNDRGSDMLPDTEDGIVDDNNGSNGILDGELPMPSPNVTHKP